MTHHTVRVMGGLGNQMFQYAFGKRLAHESRRPVVFDLDSGFRKDVHMRAPALSQFKTDIPAASADHIPVGMTWGSPWHRVAKVTWTAMPPSRRQVIYEEHPFQFDAACLTRTKPAYYFGYWQHPDYLQAIAAELGREFQLSKPMSDPVSAVAREIAQTRSVSVHMRSYLDAGRDGRVIPGALAFHGACSPEYFQQAIDRIGVDSQTVYYVFTDNLQWAKAHVQLPSTCRYVADMARCSDAEEMMLMAACRHHVISNSTFSWWGAWLGTNPDKVVVAPRVWVQSMADQSVDICPPDWVQL